MHGTQRATSDKAVYRLAGAVLLQAVQDATSHSAGKPAGAIRWMSSRDLMQDVRNAPDRYTTWFKVALERTLESVGLPATGAQPDAPGVPR